MHPTKDVLFVKKDTDGMKNFTNAHAAIYQDKLLTDIVFAHHQKQFGTKSQKPAHAHPTPSEKTVPHVQLQESGTTDQTLVIAHHQPLSGTELNVSAQPTDTVQAALNAQLQDIGTPLLTNALAIAPSSGTVKNVSAQLDISYGKEDVLNAPKDTHGKTTNVKPVHAPSRSYKF